MSEYKHITIDSLPGFRLTLRPEDDRDSTANLFKQALDAYVPLYLKALNTTEQLEAANKGKCSCVQNNLEGIKPNVTCGDV